MASSKVFAIDTETNYTDYYHNRYCLGVSVSTEDENFYIPVNHTPYLGAMEVTNLQVPPDLFKGLAGTIVMHNAKFDLHVLNRIGVEVPRHNLYDTMLMSHYIDEYPPHDLNSLGKQHLGIFKEKDLAKAMKDKWTEVPPIVMARYAEQDTNLTRQLFLKLWDEFEPFDALWREVDRDFMFLLTDIESKGIRINRALCAEMEVKCELRMAEIRDELGFDPAKPSQLHPKLFSEPPDGLGLKVTSRTPGGKPQVNDDFLEACNHPIAGLVLEYRGLSKQKSSYFTAYLNATTRDYDHLHPTFKMHGTVTGRMSCSDPNLQQVPRDSNVKNVFIPEDGKELWEIDYKNIEMRLAAVYAKQPDLLQTFASEGDVHGMVARDLGIDRQKAKTVNFLIIYGGGKRVLAHQLGITEKAADKILTDYRKRYPEIFDTMYQAQGNAEWNGYVKYWTGRHRHFKYSGEAKKAFNSVVQGGSFEIVKRGMLRIAGLGADVRNQVHDSVWVQVDDASSIGELEKVMSDWTEELFGLKFSVESKRLN